MKNKNMKRIIVLLILILIIGVSIKCCTHKDIDNSVFKNNEKTIESVQEEAKKDEEAKNSTESSKNNTSSENKSNSSSTSNKNNSSSNTGSSNSSSSGSGNKNNGSNSSSSSNTGGSSSSNSGSNNGGNSNKPSSGSNSAGNTSKPNSGSNNGGSSNKPSSGSNNSNGGNSSNTEKPAHKHNWVNVTKTVNHPAETHQEDVYEDRQVKVKDAWDEQVKTGTAQECRQCGFRTTDGDAMTEHMLENGHSCHTVYTYETVHHDAVYETQRVKVGTKTVTDKAAWTETVVTGQKCSFCGETKTN